MKTIVAGTDFTASSVNACRYAALLAQKLGCRLVIFNLYEIPMYHSTSGLIGISFPTLKAESENNLEDVIAGLSPNFPGLQIEPLAVTGRFKHEVKEFVKKHKVEAVVMGLDVRNKFSKFIYDSHGISVAGKIEAPVIIVPESYTDHRLENMLLAVDNTKKLKELPLKRIERFIKGSQLYPRVLHVRTPDEVIGPRENRVIRINGADKPVEVRKSKDVESGIKHFCYKNETDLVVLISTKHSVLYNLFNEPITKRVAFVTRVPVMSIHE
ncbi:MAG: universal stress protein [Bacteroidia bacterium]